MCFHWNGDYYVFRHYSIATLGGSDLEYAASFTRISNVSCHQSYVYVIQSRVICAANKLIPPISYNRAALSDEDKEKIENLRSSAILMHLNKYTMVSASLIVVTKLIQS